MKTLSERDTLSVGSVLLFLTLVASCGGPSTMDDIDGEGGEEATEEVGEDAEGELGEFVTLSEGAFQTAEIEIQAAEERTVVSGAVAMVPGQVEFDPARVALISPRSQGRIERLAVVEGETVEQGQPVAFLLSTEFLAAQQDYLQATRRSRVLQGTPEADQGEALAQAAMQRLRLLGVDQEWIEETLAGGTTEDFLPLTAPFAGRIVTAHALTGASVEPGEPVFTLADLSMVDVAADVPERLLGNLRIGQEVNVVFSAFPGREWTGRIARIKDELDRETRTIVALIRVANEDRSLRSGMFASVELGSAPSAPAEVAVAVPESAIVTDGPIRHLFVEIGERSYQRREVDVEVMPGQEGWVAVREGLERGEPVVVRGAFTLKAELGKAAFGEDEG